MPLEPKPRDAGVHAHDLHKAIGHDEDRQALLDMGMGWSREQVVEALECAHGNRNQAAEFLFSVSLLVLP
jgi:hypothetical protein